MDRKMTLVKEPLSIIYNTYLLIMVSIGGIAALGLSLVVKHILETMSGICTIKTAGGKRNQSVS